MIFQSLLVLFLSIVLVAVPPVLADTDPPQKTVVLLVGAEHFIGSEDAVTALRSQLADLPVKFEIERLTDSSPAADSLEKRARSIADAGRAAAVVWLDTENNGRVYFLLTDEGGSNVFDRGLQEEAIAPVQTESLALILRATVQALIEDQSTMPLPTPAKPPPPEQLGPTPRPAEEDPEQGDASRKGRLLLGLETAYAYRAYSTENPVVSGFHVGLHLRIGAYVRVFLEYEIRQPLSGSGSCVETEVRGHPITAGGRLLWQQGRFFFGPALGATVDIATYDASTSCYRVDAFVGRHRINGSVAPGFFVAVRIYKRLRFFLSAEADIVWRAGRYTAPSDSGEQEVLLEPWRVQPAATTGLSVELI